MLGAIAITRGCSSRFCSPYPGAIFDSVAGALPGAQAALVEYWLNIALLGFMLLAAFEYGLRAHLFDEPQQRNIARLVRGRVLIAQGLYAFAAAFSIFFPTWVSIALIVLVQLNYVIAPRIPILHRF